MKEEFSSNHEQQADLQAQRLAARRERTLLHIMVVDDDPVTQAMMQRLLEPNYKVTICSTVGQAIREYLWIMPDIVFLDINLGDSEFNGFDVADTIALYDTESTIVILTAHESAQHIAHARRVGAAGFMTKPFSASRILHYIQACQHAKLTGGSISWS